MNGHEYSTDLTDAEWKRVGPLLGEPSYDGPARPELRYVINGILFLLRSGADFRMSPPWSTAEAYFAQWQANGTWAKIVSALVITRREGAAVS
jgi:transposase